MNRSIRDIILVTTEGLAKPDQIVYKKEQLNNIIANVDNTAGLCTAYELVLRTKITSNKNKLIEAFDSIDLKSFWFLINKN
ncbi:MAG: hypothetical protein E6Q58_01770 [Niabella sp.]|nr:MAG: hypothetical protein E6Q58_01770 [Niabella sp.]